MGESVDARLTRLSPRWKRADAATRDAFLFAFKGKQYGDEPLLDAWLWFAAGYEPIQQQLSDKEVKITRTIGWSPEVRALVEAIDDYFDYQDFSLPNPVAERKIQAIKRARQLLQSKPNGGNEPTIQELQERHSEFIEAMGWRGSKSSLECCALICEEIGELTHELRAKVINHAAVCDELADIMLRTMDLASELNIHIAPAMKNKIEKNIENIERHKAKGRRV